QCISMIVFDILPYLDSQTTSKSGETRFITFVTDRASQRLKNYADTPTMPQENTQKPKETWEKDPSSKGKGDLGGHHPLGGRLIADSCWHDLKGSAGRPPRIQETPKICFVLAIFYVSPRSYGQITSKSSETKPNILTMSRPTLKLENGLRITSIGPKNVKNGSK